MSSSISPDKDRTASRFECPSDFVPLEYSCKKNSENETEENTELWLIKAPARFNPSSLAGLKVSLSGLKMIQSTDASPHIYSVLSSRSGPTDLYHLTSSGKAQSSSLCASGFAGILNISECFGDCNENQSPIVVPAAPVPSIPPGLKQRFQPFGSSTPAHTFQSTTSTSPLPLKKVKLESEESEDQSKKKKKKKKKDKHCREELTEVAHIKQEETSQECGELQVPELVEEEDTTERRKRKKIKKEKERKNTQDEIAVDESLIVKQEPIDTSFGDIESSVKKKKKKKKKVQDE
ncbi:DNA-directed RNA polymerase I subunit RPA34 [Bagarius yarrelli]|uniref:DNA-directed RNA polymerase I subunit RPA34 n=1 Tax=Bagarius yarrelli TaxID=175774 RepID=A0A556U792_BAGYA|nr:DNA-directed RNA polymerase I subunit RPA34 [Bagarius yarrelli]